MSIKLILIAVGIFTLLGSLAETSFAKPWKSIFPLKTTRAEVVKLLGSPTGIDEHQRAIFSHSDGTVKISWKRADCISKDFLWSEKEADDTALVYQVTLEPNVHFKSIEEYEKADPIPTETRDIKAFYKRWLEQDVSCMVGKETSACTVTNDRTGFGYSDSSESGVTAIYYFATKDETKIFLSVLQPCEITKP